tara:strand:- start:200 stop:475 length:276 start_codon:yes stop_codon:yes gene_type:complete
MKLIQLRIDEAVLPFMNGDSLYDVPSFSQDMHYIEYTYGEKSSFRKIAPDYTWEDIFISIDQLLICSEDDDHRDLSGISVSKGVMRPIWLK